MSVINLSYFWGFLIEQSNQSESGRVVSKNPCGAFLVRFGTLPGTFTLVFKGGEGCIQKLQIIRKNSTCFEYKSKTITLKASSLGDLVKKLKKEFSLSFGIPSNLLNIDVGQDYYV